MDKIKVSDWIVKYLVHLGVTDVFGYPGGMAVHFMDSLSKNKNIYSHITYNEQGAGFAANGYAQVKNDIGVAFSSSGPGFTNLVTPITNAYFDSIPVLFITFNVNSYESAIDMKVKQKGFQEMDVVSVAKNITKKAFYIKNESEIKDVFQKAVEIANDGRKGPVLIDIPMNISREYISDNFTNKLEIVDLPLKIDIDIEKMISTASRPCFIFGIGLEKVLKKKLIKLIAKFKIPVVTSMISVDLLEKENQYNYGFLGAYGCRTSNFIVAKSDLIISLGSRLDVRQISTNSVNFAPNAKLIRFDIDSDELTYKVKDTEIQIKADVVDAVEYLLKIKNDKDYSEWIRVCNDIKNELITCDYEIGNAFVCALSNYIDDDVTITTDVGQNQVWVAQSFKNKKNQRILFSGNFASMGYSLPAAIGAYYANRKPVYCFTGDGGLQMNIQELQFLNRERIPITVILMNNSSLGMIRHFQEMYMDENYTLTTKEGGYSNPNFKLLANAYGLEYKLISSINEINENIFSKCCPSLIEVALPKKTYVFPKLAMKKPNHDQEPLLDRAIFKKIMRM